MARHRRVRFEHKRRWLLGIGITVLVLVALAAYSALSARSHANEALGEFKYVEAHVSEASTAAGRVDLESHLKLSQNDALAARNALYSTVVLRIAGVVPYLGNDVTGAAQLFADAASAAGTGSNVLKALDNFQNQSTDGKISSASIVALQREVVLATSTLRSLNRSASGLYGPVAHERAAFNAKASHAYREFRSISDGLTVGRALFASSHPTNILVLPENNAEMRDQGAILTYGLMQWNGAKLSVLRTGPVQDINLATPLTVPSSAGTRKVFYGDGANQIYQSVNSPADFAWTGATAAAMFQHKTGLRVDDVVAFDVPAMAALLEVTGPLAVTGIPSEVTSSNLAAVVLHDLYSSYPVGSQVERHGQITAIATTLLDRLRSDRKNIGADIRALGGQIPGRHFLMWSSNSAAEQSLVRLGASGQVDSILPRRTFHLAVESAVAAKMDYFMSLNEQYKVTVQSNGGAWVETILTEKNNAQPGHAPSYQYGPDNINSHVPGEYVSNNFLWSPAGSQVERSTPESGLVVSGMSAVVMPQQSAKSYFWTYIPNAVVNGRFVIRLVPQGTLNPVTASVSVNGSNWSVSGPTSQTFVLGSTTVFTYSLTYR